MLYDDEYLYVMSRMVVAPGRAIVATFTERNEPIYQRDSDIELFIDAVGCNHFYKETEVNALNAVWNLMVDRPYEDGGGEHSGRIAGPGDPDYWDYSRQISGVEIVEGEVGTADGRKVWINRLAIPLGEAAEHQPTGGGRGAGAQIPRAGDRWRINLSRVEEGGRLNWVWSPQIR